MFSCVRPVTHSLNEPRHAGKKGVPAVVVIAVLSLYQKMMLLRFVIKSGRCGGRAAAAAGDVKPLGTG